MDSKQTSTRKILLCLTAALAVCCVVLLATSEETGMGEIVRPSVKQWLPYTYGLKPGKLPIRKAAPSSYSVDVLKAGNVYTATPGGSRTLLDYFKALEAKIAVEKQMRKDALFKVNAKIARDERVNAAERLKLKNAVQKQMAANAKKNADALASSMRRVQAQFAAAARLQNQRQAANNKRFRRVKKTVNANKRAAQGALRAAVVAQQRAMATAASSLNSKIRQSNNRVAANALQIASNAKKARQALAGTMRKFNKKLMFMRQEARKGRSRLAAQMAAQDKKTRAWANAKVAKVINDTASMFKRVRVQMAKDRARADRMLKQAAQKLTASMNAQKALANSRYASTLASLSKARQEANSRLNRSKQQFKMSLLQLTSVVKRQEKKFNQRTSQLSGVIQRNKMQQARVNRRLNAEMKRIINLGNAREAKRLARDRQLRGLVNRNKRAVNSQIKRMAAAFKGKLAKLRKYANKSRKMQSEALARQTSRLAKQLQRQQMQQMQKNAQLAAANARARLDAADALRAAKRDFRNRMKKLSRKVASVNRKQTKQIMKLTGIVSSNAVRSANGRRMLMMRQNAAKNDMMSALSTAIAKGENRNRKLSRKMAKMTKRTRNMLNQKVSAQIKKLQAWTKRSINQVRMEAAAERAAIKKEMTFAINAAKNQAKNNLKSTFNKVKRSMAKAALLQAKRAKANAQARAALKATIAANRKRAARMLTAAVAGLNRARLALATQTQKKLSSTNQRIDANAKSVLKNVAKVSAKMAATAASLDAKIKNNAQTFKRGLRALNSASVGAAKANASFMRKALERATKRTDKQYSKLYTKMAKLRQRTDRQLAAAVHQMNQSIARQAALTDARFRKTVKNIGAAQAQARKLVAMARKSFSTGLMTVTSTVKNTEQRLNGEINIVSGQCRSNSRQQAMINRRVWVELKRIVKLSNSRQAASARARGKLRGLMDANKKLAAKLTNSLFRALYRALTKVRGAAARARLNAAMDLTRATKRMYMKMMRVKLASLSNRGSAASNRMARLEASAQLKLAQRTFTVEVNLLTNTIVSVSSSVLRRMKRMSGVRLKNFGTQEQAMAARLQKSLATDMNRAVVRAVSTGETKAKAAVDRAARVLKKATFAMKNYIATRVEKAADVVFAKANSNRQRIADNYMSVKAYCTAARQQLQDYNLARYKMKTSGDYLVSIGDFCLTISKLAKLRPRPAFGIGMGRKIVLPLFGSSSFKVAGTLKMVNGIVNEYMQVVTQVRNRWGMGIGKYLLKKLESSMQSKGCLVIARKGSKRKQKVYINARAVGLSNKLEDFRRLAVSIKSYEATLARLTALLTKRRVKLPKLVTVAPPVWPGD